MPGETTTTLRFGNEIFAHQFLVSKNLEKVRVEKREVEKFSQFSRSELAEWSIFTPTEEGKKHLFVKSSIMTKTLQMCFGSIGELTIDNFTEPTAYFGETVSEVYFSYTINDLPDWIAQLPHPSYMRSALVSDEKRAHATFSKTNNGWILSNDLAHRPVTLETYSKE